MSKFQEGLANSNGKAPSKEIVKKVKPRDILKPEKPKKSDADVQEPKKAKKDDKSIQPKK